jgi:hypothetical protein
VVTVSVRGGAVVVSVVVAVVVFVSFVAVGWEVVVFGSPMEELVLTDVSARVVVATVAPPVVVGSPVVVLDSARLLAD